MKLWDEAYARYDGPIPDEVRAQIYAATHPPKGSRAASAFAWASVRFWATRCLGLWRACHVGTARERIEAAKEWRKSRVFLLAALDSWSIARDAEREGE